MKLQILVPHYKEQPEEIKPLLDSIAIQQAVDFFEIGVVIVSDGIDSTPLPIEWGDIYPFEIVMLMSHEKIGVSAARNYALDESVADYVMFCDADDMFCHVCGMHIIFTQMQNDFDTMTSCFIEESRHPETKETFYINHEIDSTFVHGKVHKRKYLVDNGIRFNDNLTIHEDSYFNILAQNLTEKAIYCPTPFYLWKWRDASVCRHDPDYILKTYNNMLDSNDALVDEFDRRCLHDKARFYTGLMIMDAYYTMNKKEWIDKTHSDYRKAVDERFKKYFIKHRYQWELLTDEEKMLLSNSVRQRSVMEGMPMEYITLGDWLKSVTG